MYDSKSYKLVTYYYAVFEDPFDEELSIPIAYFKREADAVYYCKFRRLLDPTLHYEYAPIIANPRIYKKLFKNPDCSVNL